MKRLMYILTLLLFAATVAAQEPYVIDQVCQGIERTYRIDGEAGSSWKWMLADADGNAIALSDPAGTDFSDTDKDGNPIQGSEITIDWEVVPGTYDLSVEQTSIHDCKVHELGQVEIYPNAEADAGNPLTVCVDDPIVLTEASATEYSSLEWTSSGDGTFDDATLLNPSYTAGENDKQNGSVILTLTAQGLLNNGTCEPAVSTIEVTINPIPNLVINDPGPICEPETFKLSDPLITAGSETGLEFTYWKDIDATEQLQNYTDIATSGTYYIKGTNPTTGCYAIKPVTLTINPMPSLVITDPDPVCEPTTIDLTDPARTAGSEAGLDFTYWKDINATEQLLDYTAVATSGTYYIKGTNPTTGCYDIQKVNITINPQPELTITDPDPVCEPTTIDLTDPAIFAGSKVPASSDTTYWEDAMATIPLTNYTAIATSGTYFIKLQAPGGCSDIQPVNVSINPRPGLIITDPDPVCEPETVDLSRPEVTAGSEPGMVLTYWEDAAASIPLDNYNNVTSSGSYYIKSTNPTTNCEIIELVEVTINPLPNLVIVNPDPVCEPETVDLSNPSITTGSETGLLFTYWEDFDATLPLSNYQTINTSGNYYIKAENPTTGCYNVKEVTVVINPQPALILNDPQEVCAPNIVDLSDPSVTQGSAVGIALSYWEDIDATQPLDNYNAITVNGTYYIKGTDPTTGCYDIKPITVTIYPIPNLVIVDPDPVCEPTTIDLTDPARTAGSDAGLDFSYWKDINATEQLLDYTAVAVSGTYYIKGTNPTTGCYDIQEVNITINPQPELTITDPDPVCEPATIDLTDPAILTGSKVPASSDTTYWEDAMAAIPLTNYTAITTSGTYFIKLLAPGGCSDIQPVNVSINPRPGLVITNPDPVCEPETVDLSLPEVTAGSEPGMVLTYWEDAKATIPLDNYNNVTSSGSYYIKSNNPTTGCEIVKLVEVIVSPQPELFISNPAPVCEPTTVDITLPSITAGSIIPSPPTISYWMDSDTTISIDNPTEIAVDGTYYIKVQAPGGCFDVKPVIVTITPLPGLVITNPDPVCEPSTVDLSLPEVTAGSEPGMVLTYWEDAAATIPLDNYNNVTSSGSYFIKSTNPTTNCTSIEKVEVTINSTPNLVISDPPAVCEPATVDLTDELITIGSDPNLTFSYWQDADASIPLDNYSAISESGIYYIMGEDQITGCSDIAAVNVLINEQPQLVITNPPAVCEPGKVDLTDPTIRSGSTIPPSSIINYWKDAAASIPVSSPENISSTGTYYIEIVAGSNCSEIKPVEVIVNPRPQLVITDPPVVCEPKTIDLSNPTITQGSNTDLPLTYWLDQNATTPLTNYDAINKSGTYYIKATQNGLCPIIKPVNVVISKPPNLVTTNPLAICEPGTVDITAPSVTAGSTIPATAVISYWLDSNTSQPLSQSDAEQISVGATYYIRVDVGNDCYDVKPVEVTIYPEPDLIIQDPTAVCEPDVIDLTASEITPGLDPALVKTYWHDQAATNEISDPTTISVEGTYYIQVESADGCKNIEPVQVIINKPDALSFNLHTQLCVNSTPPALPTTSVGGITGSWNPATISTDQTGFFDYVFTPDPGQCAVENTVTVEITDEIVPIFDPMGPYCLGTTPPALPTVSNNNITGSWSPAVISTDHLGTDTYIFTPDPGQCATSTTINITIEQSLSLDATPMNIDCKGDNSGSIQLTVTGGSGSYSYAWSNGATTRNIANLYAGTYQVTVVDQISGCENDISVTVSEPNLNDNEDPTLTAPPAVHTQCSTNWPAPYTTYSEFEAAGGYATDNLGYDVSTFEYVSEQRTQSGQSIRLERIYRIRDYCGNPATAIQVFQSKDDIPPEAICNSIEISVDENGQYQLTDIDVQEIAQGSYDNCTSFDDLVFNFSPLMFDCEMVGTTATGTLTVTDLSGNVSTCEATIIILDTFAPDITCQSVTLYLDENGQANLGVDDVLTGVDDNCGIDNISLSQTEFFCEDVGTQPEVITVTDIHGLSASCEFNVTVVDTIKPRVTCHDLEVLLDRSEQFTLTYDLISSDIWDECGVERIEISKDLLTCADIGLNPVTITVYDVNGNSNECTSNVTVIADNQQPVATNDVDTTIMNISTTIAVLDNDYDPDGSIIPSSITITKNPAHGSLQINSDNTITYTPNNQYTGPDEFTYQICDDGVPCETKCDEATVSLTVLVPNVAPVATVDQFAGGCYTIFGSLLYNDYDPNGDQIIINTTPTLEPSQGVVTIFADGTFRYEFERGDAFIDSFRYQICDDNPYPLCSETTVYITIFADADCDGVADHIDIDDDNDGIIDIVEGDRAVDTDGDGIPDSLDIDADNDGIIDIIEAQEENKYIPPSGIDNNENGLDDIYEQGSQLGLDPTDTDGDGDPDYVDTDSDNDNVPDYIEGYDIGAKGIAELVPEISDIDGDGLDDAYDNFLGGFNENDLDDPFGTNPHLQDFDNDGTRDWRDTDDDNDMIPTAHEDLNNNNIYFDDDLDFDGHPEYLDYQGECTMFIPEGFSPNGDGIHDFFQIYCIDKYPNAKLLIFDRWGNKMYEHDKYGNLSYWGSFEKAWWDGSRTNEGAFSGDKLKPGNYLYVLVKGDGNTEKGFVMVSY
ncbi:Ig-like domain-containing protein [Sunxiuqinia elliptica]